MEFDFQPISMMELRSKPGEILSQVAKNNAAFIIEKNGRHMACLVPVSAFLPDIQKEKLNEELALLRENNEQFKTSVSPSRELELRFSEKDSKEIKLVLSHGYPNVAPKAYVSSIQDDVPISYRWDDGALCLFGPMGNWEPKEHNILYALHLTRKWLDFYANWKETGKWENQGE